MAKANISNAETQSLFLLFNEHGMHRKNENPFVHLVSSVFMFIMTTDIQNLTDFHHERKRAKSDTSDTSVSFFFFEHGMHERNEGFRLFCVFRVHVYINHRYSESHRCKSRAQASISVKSVLSVFEKKNKKQIYPIYLISIPKTCRASISDTSDTSASLITSASEIICGRFYNLLIKFIAHLLSK